MRLPGGANPSKEGIFDVVRCVEVFVSRPRAGGHWCGKRRSPAEHHQELRFQPRHHAGRRQLRHPECRLRHHSRHVLFDFSSLNYQSIDSFSLTLNFGGTNGRTNILGFSIPNEMWFVRPAAGNTGSPLAYLLHPLTDAASATQVFNFNALSLFDTFNGIVSQGKFGLWFAEETPGADSFNLVSATLTVNGAAAVPEPTGLALTGLALAALALSRRRRARA
jgi:hypothetical protein